MEQKSEGIILRVRPLTETSLIIHWLTPEFGRLATVAKGARRPKSPFLGKLDLGHRAEFNFQRSARSDLHLLREVRVIAHLEALRTNVALLSQMAAAVELLERSTESDTPLPGIYPLLLDFLHWFTAPMDAAVPLLAFEIRLLRELGFPPGADPHLSAGSRPLIGKLGDLEWPLLARIRLSTAQRAELKFFLQKFILEHLGIRLKKF